MMKKSSTGETPSLRKWAEERMKLQRELEEDTKRKHKNKEPHSSLVLVPYLPQDCIFHIIVRLPLELLLTSRFVCKAWYGIVSRPDFIDAYLQRSCMGLIYLTPTVKGCPSSDVGKASSSSTMKNDFNVDAKVLELESTPALHWQLFNPHIQFQIKYLEIKDAKSTIKEYNVTCTGHIKAACNGLIVLENVMQGRGLIVMNPITREVKKVPLGTTCSPHHESYGLAFCHESSRYKLVHLFQDASQYIGCEIMYIGSARWRAADGPPHGFMGWLGYRPVLAIGALHWVPHVNQNEYIVSMRMKDEVFVKIQLPNTGGIRDRVLEIGGSLGFVSCVSGMQINVWVLKSLGGEGWAKQHSIVLNNCPRNVVPLYCMREGEELVFEHEDHLYAYDRRLQRMRGVEVNNQWHRAGCYFPHVNSLISLRM